MCLSWKGTERDFNPGNYRRHSWKRVTGDTIKRDYENGGGGTGNGIKNENSFVLGLIWSFDVKQKKKKKRVREKTKRKIYSSISIYIKNKKDSDISQLTLDILNFLRRRF